MAKVWLEWSEVFPVFTICREDESVWSDAIHLDVPDEVVAEWMRTLTRFDELQCELGKIRDAHMKVMGSLGKVK
jgi:hypothetical protein